MEEQRKLPIYTIEGTEFMVDVNQGLLIEKGHEINTIAISDMLYSRSGYRLDYDPAIRNILESIKEDYAIICIPNLTELDPVGMAGKYGISEAEVAGKADVEVIINQQQLALREGGQLPVIEICGHPFYVDLNMDCVRPKDDFSTTGIRFKDMDDYYVAELDCYRITYNPKTFKMEELDFQTIKEIPRHLVIVDIPLPSRLDPVAFARIHEFDKDSILVENGLQLHRIAKEISWEETPIKQIIAGNLKKELDIQKSEKQAARKKGRGI
ncbi:hypothetical protein SAMN05192574_103576 [Mucilaginibacter gossypiicola]|uniref:Uncharacterized protein n=1 Tax=Mucilaginibacter gossypiicola TaxID=551995 RepID=A0A1H8HNF3_9SPHI|nr:hypothetical protein [Mucilaginibacter gossypiicola]SEN57742.1 hypothetical protein SAMN05192574_103576 [Mucilaginibacter gossypiicola]